MFGDRDSGAYLHHYAWTKIVRHAPVTGRHSPDDPALAHYWADRRRKRKPPQLAESWERALRDPARTLPAVRGTAAVRGLTRQTPCTQWETWYTGIRKALAHQAITAHGSGRTTSRLVHAHCARRHPDDQPHDTDQ